MQWIQDIRWLTIILYMIQQLEKLERELKD